MKAITITIALTLCLFNCKSLDSHTEIITKPTSSINWNNEVIYHVMPRSFYDSNGDLHGDLNGFVEKLDYLKELGVTTILFTPLYESGFYHNYFPTDYYAIDPEYGTKEDYINFVKAVHKKGLKFIMDMETQYAQGEHIWFADSYKNPQSEYSDFVYYSDSLNVYPEQIFMESRSPLFGFKTWPNDRAYNIVILDLNKPKVKSWMKDFYTYWVDPNGDGNFDDGVDGFRIDHIMDDLDYKGIITNMYQDFWKPIFEACKAINPNIFVLGEQSNWADTGEQMVKQSGADAAFNFGLKFAISNEEKTMDMFSSADKKETSIDPQQIHKVVQETMDTFNNGTYSVTFLENHDTARYATVVQEHDGLKRIGAILNLFLPGLPSIYYGQELGVTGRIVDWGSDTNHLPLREAFPWTDNPEDEGIALFYKNTGEWWDISFWQTDAIKQLALTNQKTDKNSLWHHYKKLLDIRKTHEAFRLGDYAPLLTDVNGVLAFERKTDNETVAVLVNLTGESIVVPRFNIDDWQGETLYGKIKTNASKSLVLDPYGYLVLKK